MSLSISMIPEIQSGSDYYKEFVEGSRWLREEQAEARAAWFSGLPTGTRSQDLFRLEMLLKGLVCFGNPSNHPGRPWIEKSVSSKELNNELDLILSMIRNIVDTGKQLLGGKDNSVVFKRYIESVISNDHSRIKMVKKSLVQDTPEQSLSLLVSAVQNLQDLVEGLVIASSISYRLFGAVIITAQREIHRSEYFDSLATFEFRTEYDRIQNERVLTVLSAIESDSSRRVAALTFLALFRLIQYLDLIEVEDTQEVGFGPLFAFLALLRSDGLEIAAFLSKDASAWMADGFGRQFMELGPGELTERFDGFDLEFEGLKSLGELLSSTGDQMMLEFKKVFEQQLPTLDDVQDPDLLRRDIKLSTDSLRSFLQNAIALLVKEFDHSVEGDLLFDDFTSDATRSQRLRRDIWMFQQILKAFIAKTEGSVGSTDHWAGLNTFKFVRTFVSYFKSMGYQLLRYSDYDRFDTFMGLVGRLRDGDLLEVHRLPQVIAECEKFAEYLSQMFESVSQREELANSPFDKKDAAKTLKLFLGHTDD